MPALRCSICALDWPLEDEYKRCESCGGKTSPIGNVEAMSADEAKSQWSHFKFANLYDEDKPLAPDAAIDARYTLENWKAEAKSLQASKAASGAKQLLPSSNPVFRLRTP